MAGKFADSAKADLLVLNHIGDSEDTTQVSAKAANEVIKGRTRVVSALDLMEVAIPRDGFMFPAKEDESTL